MKCPKCNSDIDDNLLVCPNCKKVLKLVCPKCNTINKNNVCKKCGFTIITKCHNCGKINQTINGKCSKCGFSTHTSVLVNLSNIDEFACLLITFPNLEDMKKALGSTKLFDKFKVNLDKLIIDYTNSNNLTREIIDGVYVIRFNKSFSFSDSANTAVNGAIDILNSITELNYKLTKIKDVLLQCNITIVKRDINTLPEDYKSGIDIKLIYQGKANLKLINCLQVITDSAVYEKVCDNFDLSSLSSTFVKKQMIMFFELNIKKYVKIPVEKEEVNDLPELPVFDNQVTLQEDDDSDIYNIDAINFEELKCDFINDEAISVESKVLEKINTNPVNIITVKAENEFMPDGQEMIEKIEKLQRFENVFKVICYDDMKYKPYGFFQELILDICKFTKAPVNFLNNSFDMFETIDPVGYIQNLINAIELEDANPEEVRYALFDIFFNICSSIPNSLIYIESFDKIDDTSYEILQLFFERVEELGVSYLILADKEFKLHKDSHFLLASPHYSEITAKPSGLKSILTKDIKKYQQIIESYYIEKIAHCFMGSVLYFNQAIAYLIDNGIFALNENVLSEAGSENILIPVSLPALIAKRLRYLSKDKIAYKLLGMLLLIGPSVDLTTLKLLDIPDEQFQLQKLIDKKYLYVENESIYFKNYNLYKENFLATVNKEVKQSVAKELLGKIYNFESPTPTELYLYNVLNMSKEEFYSLDKLSRLNSSLGDFSAYLCCSVKFLTMVNEQFVDDAPKSKDEYKFEVYENISNLLYKYSPEKVHNIATIILDNLEKSTDNQKIVELCNKMLQGCLVTGNYQYALGLIRKILSSFPDLSANPYDENFNIAFFFISLIKVEILFSIGNLKDCIEAADEILEVLNAESIQAIIPENFELQQFEDMIFDAMSFSALAQVILLSNDYEKFAENLYFKIGRLPSIFELISFVQNVLRGVKFEIPEDFELGQDRFSKIIINLILAFNELADDYKKFASYIYQAKIQAKIQRLFQIELICDLLIGYSYFKLNQIKKAASIYYSVLETGEKNSLKIIYQLSWYLISIMKYEEGSLDAAYGIANNAVIQLEKDENSSDYLFFLFKVVLCKILISKQNNDLATLCLDDAEYLAQKYGIEIDMGLNQYEDTQEALNQGEVEEETEVVEENQFAIETELEENDSIDGQDENLNIESMDIDN